MSRQSQDDGLDLVRGLFNGLVIEADVVLFYFVVAALLNLLRAFGVL